MIAGVAFPFPWAGVGPCHCCVSCAEAELCRPSLGTVWVLSVPIPAQCWSEAACGTWLLAACPSWAAGQAAGGVCCCVSPLLVWGMFPGGSAPALGSLVTFPVMVSALIFPTIPCVNQGSRMFGMAHGEHWHTQSRGRGRRVCLAPCQPRGRAPGAAPSPHCDQMNVSAGGSASARPPLLRCSALGLDYLWKCDQ